MTTPGDRIVSVAPERLAGWVAGFAERHGQPEATPSTGYLELRAPDGAVARVRLAWGPLVAGDPMAGEPVAGDLVAGDLVAGDPVAGDPAAGEPVAGDPVAGDLVAGLIEQCLRPRRIGALIVRRKAHAVGVFVGSTLVSGSHGSHYVQGRTKAGGWSQQRYARRRANQTERSFTAAAEAAAAVLLPEAGQLEALALGGENSAVASVLAQPQLAALAALPRLGTFAVPDPNAGVLAGFGEVFRRVRIELNELA